MIKFLIYLYPVLVNLGQGMSFFITQSRLSKAGASPVLVTSTLSVWGFFTVLSVFGVGTILTEKRASFLVMLGSMFYMVSYLGFIVVPGLYVQFFWLFLSGIATAFFCAPFQVFMKKVEHGADSGIVRATAFYGAAWSFGMGLGPFIAGALMNRYPEFGWKAAYGMTAVLMLLMTLSVKPLERYSEGKSVEALRKTASLPPPDFSGKPDLALYGWILTGSAFAVVAAIKSLLPWRASALHLSDLTTGGLIAVIYFVQSIVCISLFRSRNWMYKPATGLISSVAAVLAISFLALAPSSLVLYPAAALLGFYSGIVSFCLVFYSLVHPVKAPKYIAINEITVGICNVCGPLLAGCIARVWGGAASFWMALIPVVIAGSLYVARLMKIPRTVSE